MAAKKQDATGALVTVMGALEPLSAADKQWVLQSVASRWGLNFHSAVVSPTGFLPGSTPEFGATLGTATTNVQAAIANKDARAFIRIKRPETDVQRVACLGYFLVHTTGQQGFSSKDIGKAHTDSGDPGINMARALDNATRQSKYLSNRGPKEKQLTTLGEDIVIALPDQQAVKDAESAAKVRGVKRRAKKNRKKKIHKKSA